MTARRYVLVLLALPLLYVGWIVAGAMMLLRVSDTISTSAPNATSTHTIRFTANQAIPPAGSIAIAPHAGAFTIPSAFDYVDVDLAVSSGGAYIDRDLAGTASATEDGVAVIPGASGSITIQLNATSGIAAGDMVEIELGTNASFGTTSDQMIINPVSVGSYRIDVSTKDAGGGAIDSARTMIAIISPVQASSLAENTAPGRSGGLPDSEIAAGNDEVEISLETDEPATCRYSTTPDTDYDSMTEEFKSAGLVVFYTTVTGLENSTSYTYYVRCKDTRDTVNTDDYPITFSLAANPISNTSIATSNQAGQGTGPIPGGSNVLFLASVTLSGLTSPQSSVTILRDGTAASSAIAGSDGTFSAKLTGLERGVYTFLAYSTDRSTRKSASVGTTITLGQGTSNAIANILIPPTLAATAVPEGGARVVGESVPGGVVELFAQGGGGEKKYTATANGSGQWEVVMPGSDVRGTMALRARVRIGDRLSELSEVVTLGGEGSATASDDGDQNGDSKVNLVDFSIMLSFWGTSEASADINGDGTVNLADFSILLFNWTG